MRKTLRRTVTVGIIAIVAILVVIFSPSPAVSAENGTPVGNGLYVNGMDGIIDLSDNHGNVMTLKAECARIVVDFGYSNLADFVRSDDTANPDYLAVCFDPPKAS